jgi:cytoskeletal protein RodZ
MFEDVDNEYESSPPPEEGDNRTFLIAAGVLGGITLLALICMAAYVLLIAPGQRNQRNVELTQSAAQNTEAALVARAQTQTASAPTATSLPTSTSTPTNSPTPVIAQSTNTPVVGTATIGPRTATVAALLTQAAQQTLTVFPTSTGLPDTGFADDVGAPSLLALAVLFVVVIFLVRRLRGAGTQ